MTATATATTPRSPEDAELAFASAEATEVHTRILRLALAVRESAAYWKHVVPGELAGAQEAAKQRWFGQKNPKWVRYLIATFAERYGAFEEALAVLARWRGMDLPTQRLVCHWHLQLSDVIYRRFTGEFLLTARGRADGKVGRDAALRWLKSLYRNRWGEATNVQFASKLLSAATEAGLVAPGRDPRPVIVPPVPDVALAYLLHLLRRTRIKGTLLENPYLASVGLEGGQLETRLSTLPGVRLRRVNGVANLQWGAADLTSWAAGLK